MERVAVDEVAAMSRIALLEQGADQETDDPADDRAHDRDEEKLAPETAADATEREEAKGENRGLKGRGDHGTHGPGNDPDEDVTHAQKHQSTF
jgi:hypothetical protein